MPLIIPSNTISGVGYEVDNSLRFDDGSSDYLNRTQETGNQRTYTISFWVKRQDLERENQLITARYSNLTRYAWIFFNNEASPDKDRLHVQSGIYSTSSTTTSMRFTTTRVFRDVSAWYHIVIAVDTTQSTESDRVKIYVNGEQETDFTNETYPSQNDQHFFNINTTPMEIGAFNAGRFFSGYMSEVVLIDGQQLDPTSFGEFDADSGIWKPIDVSGLTFGTNGFYLDFENSGSLGADVSGNSNNFTVNNLTSIDQTTDTPTNNYATLNGLNYQTSSALSEGNTKIVGVNADQFLSSSNIGVSSGKWYVEAKMTALSGGQGQFGITGNASEQNRNNRWTGQDTYSYGLANNDGLYYNASVQSGTWTTYTTNDIISIALDLDNNLIYFYKNGTVMNSGTGFSITDPANQPDGNYFFAVSDGNASFNVTWEMNFGNPPFTISSGNSDANGYGNMEYEIPSGYYVLNSKNLAEFG